MCILQRPVPWLHPTLGRGWRWVEPSDCINSALRDGDTLCSPSTNSSTTPPISLYFARTLAKFQRALYSDWGVGPDLFLPFGVAGGIAPSK